jgi:hypothetical protein
MTRPGADDELKAVSVSQDAGAIPASLKAEYDELFAKRAHLRDELERAKAKLADLKARSSARRAS